ncbi:kinase-like protein [Aureobasidium sp. EXF-10728]|nr:kinase-like protein [Aureobasidium sp. EXF-10728]
MQDFTSKLSIGSTVSSFSDRKLKYKIKRRIGHGGFGNVLEVQRLKDQKVFAMKVVSTVGSHHKQTNAVIFRAEATRLTQTKKHPNLMELLDLLVFEDLQEGGLILEFATEGNLHDLHLRLPKNQHAALSQLATYQMTEALHHIHSLKPAIVHRDIKPDNILVFLAGNEREPHYLLKLADFGISQTVDDDTDPDLPYEPMSGRAFKPYRAPETAQELGNVHTRGFESRADIWSLGVLLLKIHNTTVSNFLVAPNRCSIPTQAIPLIKAMLTQDPSRRASAQECKRYLWYKEGATTVIHKAANGCKENDPLGDSMKRLSID